MIAPRRERIIYTRHDGGVSIVHPSALCMLWMASGGRWAGMPHGYIDTQIDRQIAAGRDERAVVRFCLAMAFGGCTDAEALDIIRGRDCGHKGTAFDLVDYSDVPTDRWFRNAWRRSHNGGPIYIDMRQARKIQKKEIGCAAKRIGASLQWGRWNDRLRKAETPEELKRIFPAW